MSYVQGILCGQGTQVNIGSPANNQTSTLSTTCECDANYVFDNELFMYNNCFYPENVRIPLNATAVATCIGMLLACVYFAWNSLSHARQLCLIACAIELFSALRFVIQLAAPPPSSSSPPNVGRSIAPLWMYILATHSIVCIAMPMVLYVILKHSFARFQKMNLLRSFAQSAIVLDVVYSTLVVGLCAAMTSANANSEDPSARALYNRLLGGYHLSLACVGPGIIWLVNRMALGFERDIAKLITAFPSPPPPPPPVSVATNEPAEVGPAAAAAVQRSPIHSEKRAKHRSSQRVPVVSENPLVFFQRTVTYLKRVLLGASVVGTSFAAALGLPPMFVPAVPYTFVIQFVGLFCYHGVCAALITFAVRKKSAARSSSNSPGGSSRGSTRDGNPANGNHAMVGHTGGEAAFGSAAAAAAAVSRERRVYDGSSASKTTSDNAVAILEDPTATTNSINAPM